VKEEWLLNQDAWDVPDQEEPPAAGSLSAAQLRVRELRRYKVAYWLARGYSRREIQLALAAPVAEGGVRNPATGKPYCLYVVQKDCEYLEQQWFDAAKREVADHRARQLAELREIRKSIWDGAAQANLEPDYVNLLRALKQEAELVGSQAMDPSGAAPKTVIVQFQGDLPDGAI
jgi:hypothetical protein